MASASRAAESSQAAEASRAAAASREAEKSAAAAAAEASRSAEAEAEAVAEAEREAEASAEVEVAAAEEESAASAGGDGLSAEGQQAVRQAQSYLSFTAFSRSGLIDQLEFEGFSNADATAAVDSLDVDYAAQAVKQAQSYLTHTAFSRTGLIDQLEFEGYSNADATAAVDGLGIDYNEQAAKQAKKLKKKAEAEVFVEDTNGDVAMVDVEVEDDDRDDRQGPQAVEPGEVAAAGTAGRPRTAASGWSGRSRPCTAFSMDGKRCVCTPTTRMSGLSALAAVATPAIRPPPPTDTTRVSRSGCSASISNASVPWPAATPSSSKGCTKVRFCASASA